MYNYYQQQPTVTQPLRSIAGPYPLKGHPVSGLEEVRAAQIDFDGSIFFFPDIANKKIYTKSIDMNGMAQLNMYELKPIPTDPTPEDYITRTEFNQTLETLLQKLMPKEENTKNKEYKEVF